MRDGQRNKRNVFGFMSQHDYHRLKHNMRITSYVKANHIFSSSRNLIMQLKIEECIRKGYFTEELEN